MPSTLIPRRILFGNPERASPSISPDGTRLGWLQPREGVLNVWVEEIGSGRPPRCVTDDRSRGVRAWRWAWDNRHLVYVQDSGGDENWHLHAVDLESGTARDLTPFDGVQAQLIHSDPGHPGVLVVGLNRDNPQLHDLYDLTLESGDLRLSLKNPGLVSFAVDQKLVARAGLKPHPDGAMSLMVRDAAGGPWRERLRFAAADALSSDPVAVTADGRGLYVRSSSGVNASRLLRIDLASSAEDLLAADSRYDVSAVVIQPRTRVPQLVAFQRERLEWQVLDESVREDLSRLAELQAGDLRLLGRDLADRTWLVSFNRDDGPVGYYSWDRAGRRATLLFEHQPALAGLSLARMEPFSFAASDGLRIHGYLTFPPDGERRALPAVLNVHGGPWARDVWGFNPEAQWLANRGYLCVQVNFRGSTGYGKGFVNAGNGEWGRKMHQDLLDAVESVVARGYADPRRVGIYGASYGGYAALCAAAFTPERFACAVDIVGPSSLKTLIESVPPYWEPLIGVFHERVGHPERDADLLWSRSPLSRVDNIRIPLLIAQGANDPRVKREESEQIVRALESHGIDHEYVVYPDEGHGFARPENRLDFYARTERFLARHLGGRAED